ncbi:hypothetical protein PPN31119_03176 [Pandoraea pnomenusa]|uniref:Secreted protein n=1 Tax=Pandoraea pnomenusa TaxID=93220 RepID=A0ABY6WM23_9BURK|nr:hypothetical protein [Pandoraea pnomenusa]VVE69111.1 hypothetical protein PPN31119_03176 [Pandoraea pnomenusa]
MMTKSGVAATLVAVAGIMIGAQNASATSIEKSCMAQKCAAGDKAITYATKQEPYFACPTRELAEYTNFVIGLVATQRMLTGSFPNISPKTGEPEYLDQGGKPNETRLMFDQMRESARVSTFDQGVAMCKTGANKAQVTIMNVPTDATVVWVNDDKKKVSFWMPRGSLDKR